jgi:predicted nuclease of predicted toxin-antitoxin system
VLFAWAAANGAVILTQDLGFAALLAQAAAKLPSIALIRSNDIDPAVIADLVIKTLRREESALKEGAIVSIDPSGSRTRRLPLR